jgi:cytochrome c oxidase cbb3-type subunit 3
MKHFYRFSALMVTGLLTSDLMAQSQGADAAGGSMFTTQNLLWGGLIIATITILILYRLLMSVVKMYELKIYEEHGITEYMKEKDRDQGWSRFTRSWTKVVPLEREEEILSPYDYDGIRELDNKLPPWWLWLFYITIGIAVVYLFYYHLSGREWSSGKEWEQEIEMAQAKVDAYLATKADLVNENTVTLLTDEAGLAAGKEIFDAKCAVCHAVDGGGGVGPNMTDEYWLHGGDIKDLFRTVKVGVPEKGMISWKSQLRPVQMQQVSSYILASLQGTTPADPKEPQGELYVPPVVEEEEAVEEAETSTE